MLFTFLLRKYCREAQLHSEGRKCDLSAGQGAGNGSSNRGKVRTVRSNEHFTHRQIQLYLGLRQRVGVCGLRLFIIECMFCSLGYIFKYYVVVLFVIYLFIQCFICFLFIYSMLCDAVFYCKDYCCFLLSCQC